MARSGTDTEEKLQQRPPQHQAVQSGRQTDMTPKPLVDEPDYRPAHKLIEDLRRFGNDTPLCRAAQPAKLALSDLATKDLSYITSQALHPNGGTLVSD